MYISHQHKLLYMPLPKSGCTTIKKLLWYMDSGFPVKGDIHNAFYTEDFNNLLQILTDDKVKSYYKFCVVRDPVDRLISAYNHRVLVKGEIRDNPQISITSDPPFFEFVNNLEKYRSIPVIDHHVSPMCRWLGTDANYYDKIYKLRDIDTHIIPLLESKCGHNLTIDMSVNSSPHVIKRLDISKDLEDKIKSIYKKDYDVFGKYL